jgi:hypothetical protein
MRTLARELGDRLAPRSLIRLLVSQATSAGLATLYEEDAQRALLDPLRPELQPPDIEPRPEGGWRARFASITHFPAEGRSVVRDWEAEYTPLRGLVWWSAERD